MLPIKLFPLLYLLICTAWSLFSPSCYSLLICCHPFSTIYIFFPKNHQSLIPLCITSSVESTSCLIRPALHKTPCWWHRILQFTFLLLTTLTLHHTFTVPFQPQNSPFPQIFSTIVSYHPPGLPSRTILDRTYSAQHFSLFSLIFSFYFGSCGRLSWLNCQLSSTR